jgi:uncharacterized membrane protein
MLGTVLWRATKRVSEQSPRWGEAARLSFALTCVLVLVVPVASWPWWIFTAALAFTGWVFGEHLKGLSRSGTPAGDAVRSWTLMALLGSVGLTSVLLAQWLFSYQVVGGLAFLAGFLTLGLWGLSMLQLFAIVGGFWSEKEDALDRQLRHERMGGNAPKQLPCGLQWDGIFGGRRVRVVLDNAAIPAQT